MANPVFWSNVGIDVQTAIAAAKTITAITKANPGVVTAAAHGYANGDYVYLGVNGMFEVDQRVFRVANITTNTFELEGEDTTTYNTFVAGGSGAQLLTFGASFNTVQDVSFSGGEPEFADTTTVHDNVRRRVPTVVSSMSASLNAIYDRTDPAEIELAKATKQKTQRAIRLRFSNGNKLVGSAFASAAGVPTGSAQEVVKTPITLEFQGLPTPYST